MSAYQAQTIEKGGVPYSEYRTAPDFTDYPIVTIEFTPDPDRCGIYAYPQPKFVPTEEVTLRVHWEYCRDNSLDLSAELEYFRLCAVEIVEDMDERGRLKAPPYWLYGFRTPSGTKELIWFEEDDLVAKREITLDYD